MSYEVTAVKRVRQYTEPAGSFGQDHSGTLNDFSDLPVIEGSVEVSLDKPQLDPETQQQHLDEMPEQHFGPEACTMSFQINIAPTGTAAAAGTTQVQGPLGELLAAIFGDETLGTGVTTQSSNLSRTSFDCTTTGNSIVPGGAFGIVQDGTYYMREIESVSGQTVTSKLELPSAVTTGATVFGCATYALDQDPDTSLQYIIEGEELQDRWLLLGMQVESFSMETPVGELPRCTVTLKGAGYKHESSASGSFSSTLGDASYTNTTIIATEGPYNLQTVGTATLTGSTAHVPSITWNWQLSTVPIKSTSGVNTIARWRRTRNKPTLTIENAFYYQDTTYFDARDNKTKKAHFLQLNTTKGKSVLLSVPTTQIIDVQMADQEGIVAQSTTFVARNDQDTAGGTSDREQSVFRMHFG